MDEWINVKFRVPGHEQRVTVINPEGIEEECIYHQKYGFQPTSCGGLVSYYNVKRWKPLNKIDPLQ